MPVTEPQSSIEIAGNRWSPPATPPPMSPPAEADLGVLARVAGEYRGGMFERFSEAARQALVQAHAAARELGHPFIAPQHLLIGLARVGALGAISEARLTEDVVVALGPPGGDVAGQIPFTPEAQRCLERTIERTPGQIRPAHVVRELIAEDHLAALVDRSGGDLEALAVVDDRPEDDDRPLEVTIGDELIGDLGNPATDVRVIGAILRRGGLAAGWLRTAGIDEAWVQEFGG